MNYLKLPIIITVFAMLSGFASAATTAACKPEIGRALSGNNTVVITISLDKNGIPQQNFKSIELQPGQTALFAGPDKFEIVFKGNKTPNKIVENTSTGGTVAIKIPDDIFTQSEFVAEYRKNNFLRFNYAIRVNGKELDPPMIIGRTI